MTRLRAALAMMVVLLLAACGGQMGLNNATGCMFELNSTGSYGVPVGEAVPTVVPGSDGIQAGADAINACIRARTAAQQAQQSTPAPVVNNAVQGTGSTVTQTYTYGTPRDLIQPQSSNPAQPASQVGAPQPGDRDCNLRMTGSSGYTCEVRFDSRRN